MIHSLKGLTPDIDDSCFVAGSATVVGNVRMGNEPQAPGRTAASSASRSGVSSSRGGNS